MMAVTAADPVDLVDYDPFADGVLAKVVPTTEPQREIWLADQLGQDASLAFNESVSLHLRGELDVLAMEQALQRLLDRHTALRATVSPDGDTLCIQESQQVNLTYVDLSAVSEPEQGDLVGNHKHAAVTTAFDLQRGPLLRSELLKLGAQEHVLVLTAHHIICDGWSWWILVRELSVGYAQARGLETHELEPADDFAAYALAECERTQHPSYATDEKYWLDRFSGGTPVLDLPVDHLRPSRRGFQSSREDYVLDAKLVAAVRTLGARRGASLFATLLASFATLLSRLTGDDRIVVGILAAGQAVDGHDTLVGHCVNTLPLLFDLDLTQPAGKAIDDAQATLLDALDHQRYTFGTLLRKLKVARDPSRLPLISVMFNIDQALDQETMAFPGLQLDFSTNPRRYEIFELFVNAVQIGGALRLECQYNRGLFDPATIRHWLGYWRCMLEAMVADQGAAFGSLPLLTEIERRQVLEKWNDTRADYGDACVHDLFEQQAARRPEAVAVECGEHRLTYAQLNGQANRIANHLRDLGIQPDDRVAICTERGIQLVVAMLAVLKAGGACVPLDPACSAQTLAAILDDSAPKAVLYQGNQRATAEALAVPGVAWFDLDAAAPPWQDALSNNLSRRAVGLDANKLAYVLYGSGVPGQPTGVMVEHAALVNYLAWAARCYTPSKGSLISSSVPFETVATSVWTTMVSGGTVRLLPQKQEITSLLALLRQPSGHGFVRITPAQLAVLGKRLQAEGGAFHADTFVVVGEVLPMATVQLWRELQPGVRIVNEYGPAEAVVACCAYEVPEQLPECDVVPIGRAIANARMYILDRFGQPVPPGVVGELHVGGAALARGYLDQAVPTSKRFLADPFTRTPEARMFRTGALARWLADGTIQYVGRDDEAPTRSGCTGLERGQNGTGGCNRVTLARAANEHDGRAEAGAFLLAEQSPPHWQLDCSIVDLLAPAFLRHADRIAAQCGPDRLTYAELDTRARAIAQGLAGRGIGPGNLVGIYMPRSLDMLAATLGVMYSGAAYVPLDPAFPTDRLEWMVSHSGLQQIIAPDGIQIPVEVTRVASIASIAALLADGTGSGVALPAIDADSAAYVLYTSGSTGKPKGVQVLHRNLVNFLLAMQQAPGMDSDDVICAATTLSFDIAALELYLPLLCGAKVVIAEGHEHRDPEALARLIERCGCTVLQATPALLSLLLQVERDAILTPLKLLIGGEAFPVPLARLAVAHAREVWNMYGPTETTVWSSIARLDDSCIDSIPLGRPIANTRLYLLDADRKPIMAGASGEIWIAGAGVAAGYLHRPDLTAERFLDDPFAGSGERMYRTGDLGRIDGDRLYFQGRVDDQIKLRGFRIEPGEIEAVAAVEPGVVECAVVLREVDGDPVLALFVGSDHQPADLAARLRKRLAQGLPPYMQPHHILVMGALPKTPNQKIDRRGLPSPTSESLARSPSVTVDAGPEDQLSSQLRALWQKLLRQDSIGVHDDFFELGGYSLLAVKMFAQIRRQFAVDLPLATLVEHPTIAQLAKVLRTQGVATRQVQSSTRIAKVLEGSGTLVQLAAGRTDVPPLFMVHAVGGNVLNYLAIAREMAPERATYGLQAFGLDGKHALVSDVGEMARRYADEIRTLWPEGPYLLAGASMGGVLALEVARQLKAAGGHVALVALIDTYGPDITQPGKQIARRWPQWFSYGHVLKEKRTREMALHRLYFRLVVVPLLHVRKVFGSSSAHGELRIRDVEKANYTALAKHRIEYYPGEVVLFRATDKLITDDPILGWGGHVAAVRTVDVQGLHENVVEQPGLPAEIRRAIDALAIADARPANDEAM